MGERLIQYSESVHTLRGHTSTVRCLKMSDANTAISGSRDTTLRVWDIKTVSNLSDLPLDIIQNDLPDLDSLPCIIFEKSLLMNSL